MTSSHGRGIQSRRALAILTWITLVVVAGLLWSGQYQRTIRVQAWEPAAILLSGYATFLSIFGWLLFSPGRKSAEESPALFFSGLLTLLPPCFIAYHLMPVGSPLKPWLTIGVFVFGVLAIMSPLPEEVFAVPRGRRSYLQPLTNSYLSELDASEPQVTFDDLVPRTAFRLSGPVREPERSSARDTRDPWADPFYGTGRQMSRVGASQSRRSEELKKQDRDPLTDEARQSTTSRPVREVQPPPAPPISQLLPGRRLSEPADVTSFDESADRSLPLRTGPETASSPTVPSRRIDRPVTETSGAGSHEPDPLLRDPVVKGPPSVSAGAAPVLRRPLSEPAPRSSSPVGFQTPGPRTPVVQPLPPPLPVSALPNTTTESSSPKISNLQEMNLQEMDRQFRLMEEDDAEELPDPSEDATAVKTRTTGPESGITRTVQQSPADVRLERVRDELGGEMIEGTIVAFFEVGQKRAHLHVPFSPPLPGLPEVECEPVGEESIRVKVAVRQPYGIRIEARRAEASESLKTEISFAAVYTPPPRRA